MNPKEFFKDFWKLNKTGFVCSSIAVIFFSFFVYAKFNPGSLFKFEGVLSSIFLGYSYFGIITFFMIFFIGWLEK
jgi:hypothetical protein